MLTLEICAATLNSARYAAQGGAHRIEMCENLQLGGITPSNELLQKVLSETKIRTHVLIRPRSGDFVYSHQEVDEMLASIEMAKAAGCHGIVIGALDRFGNLDENIIKLLLHAANGLPVTFHRAIDVSADSIMLLKNLVNLGFDYVLTSGHESSAELGIPMLRNMHEQFGNHISIIAGGGINSNNIQRIAAETNIEQFHSSARKPGNKGSIDLANQFGIGVKSGIPEFRDETDLEEVKRLTDLCGSDQQN